MGNSQFNSAKDGEGGSGREGEGFSSYPETRTNAGAPSAFSDAGFAPSMRPPGGEGRHRYAGVAAPGETGLAARSKPPGGSVGDAMDVESKTEEGDEEEVRRVDCFCWEVEEVLMRLRSAAERGRPQLVPPASQLER